MARPARPSQPRLAPKTDVTDDDAEVLARAGTRPGRDPLNIFSTMVHNRRVANRTVLLGGAFLGKGTISGREREIVILRVGHNASAQYEFGQHVVIGRREGLTDDEIASLATEDPGDDWATTERALIALADELCDVDCVSDETWATLSQTFDEGQMVELVVLAGYYRMISGFLNSAGVQLDEGVPGWPEGRG